MRILYVIVGMAVSLSAMAQGMLVDLGDKGSQTGYAAQSERGPGGSQKVYAYDWVCQPPAARPANGQVTVPLSSNECVDKRSNQIIQKRADSYSSCYPIDGGGASGDSSSQDFQSTITLGARQCFDASSRSVSAMVKKYRDAYYVAGGEAKDLEGGQQDHGGSGAGAAAAAAGAAAAGIFSGCSANPFAMCSGGRPGPKDPMRGCFDFLCPFGR